ncbi:NPRL2 [Mytilus coruscus]|uniref:NPRL2 n=1 Tax=Mytilus coruscus TaxID=42192 RepID=A0A6J8AP85_MYTCO|nr:NPRL2 [Mytilus coruscus]
MSENEALSQEHNRENILQFLGTLMHQLNKYGYCSIRMGESCTVHLKVAPKIYDPPPVQDQDVPVFLKDKQNLKLGHWDLTTQQNFLLPHVSMILSYIDGFKHVAKIAGEADVEINLVKSCLQNLVHYQVIKVIPIFQYSNVYTTRPDIQTLYTNKRLQEECIKFVAKKGSLQPPNFRDIFLLYCSLGPGVTVKDICSRFNPHALKIDERVLLNQGKTDVYSNQFVLVFPSEIFSWPLTFKPVDLGTETLCEYSPLPEGVPFTREKKLIGDSHGQKLSSP